MNPFREFINFKLNVYNMSVFCPIVQRGASCVNFYMLTLQQSPSKLGFTITENPLGGKGDNENDKKIEFLLRFTGS